MFSTLILRPVLPLTSVLDVYVTLIWKRHEHLFTFYHRRMPSITKERELAPSVPKQAFVVWRLAFRCREMNRTCRVWRYYVEPWNTSVSWRRFWMKTSIQTSLTVPKQMVESGTCARKDLRRWATAPRLHLGYVYVYFRLDWPVRKTALADTLTVEPSLLKAEMPALPFLQTSPHKRRPTSQSKLTATTSLFCSVQHH